MNIEEYLKPTFVIDSDTESIKEKARNLISGRETKVEEAKSLFYFVRDEIKYNMYSPRYPIKHYRASTVLSRGDGFCIQKAILLVALARAVEIPARLRFAAIRNYLLPEKVVEVLGTNLLADHGYAELYLEEKWIKATPAFDIKMCLKNRIIPVEFDGKTDSVFHSHNQDGKLYIEYVKDHGYYQDFPLDKICRIIISAYGFERAERYKTSFWKRS